MQTKSSPFKTAAAVIGGVAFLIAGATLAWHSRHYQVTGDPMPNGKGGFMSFRDGYLLAGTLLAMSLGWFVAARNFRRSGLSSSAHESEAPAMPSAVGPPRLITNVKHHGRAGLKRKLTITVGRKGDEFKAWCKQVPGVYTLGRDKEDTLKRLKIAIYRKLKLWTWRDSDGGAGGGAAQKPHPVSPSPRGPIISEEAHEKPDA